MYDFFLQNTKTYAKILIVIEKHRPVYTFLATYCYN